MVAFVVSFGVWFVLFPRSVIAFYDWFHRGKVVLPNPSVVRLVGTLCVALVIAVMWINFRR